LFSDEELARARSILEDATASAQWTVEHKQGEPLNNAAEIASSGYSLTGEEWREAYFRAAAAFERQSGRVEALESKMTKLLKGYEAKCGECHVEIQKIGESIADKLVELSSMRLLAAREAATVPLRVAHMETLLQSALAFARELQLRFAGEETQSGM